MARRALACLLTLVALLAPWDASPIPGQEPERPPEQQPEPDRPRVPAQHNARVVEFEPPSGAPGTPVDVHALNLPAITPVYLALGGTRSGFEVLAELMTTPGGEIEQTVRVPGWATRDRLHKFIVLDIYFRQLAASRVFHVTDADGAVVRVGRILPGGMACVSMEGEDGELYRLMGDTAGLEPGDAVVVEGRITEATGCMEGVALEVVRVRPS